MAPNAEEDLLVTMPRGPHSTKSAERLRPPTYNAEDYAVALRRWGRKPPSQQDSHGTLPSTCTSSSSGYASANGEMTLRQFTSVTELLAKLRQDLKLAFPSFVQEFASEGTALLLETLRGVQIAQAGPSSGQSGPLRPRARRAALDELECLECLWSCAERCPETSRFLAQASPGLLALAVCLTSSLNRSRVIALQLLSRVCQTSGGHAAVSEAMSTLRLRYAEGGRFRFLAGALLACKAQLALRVAGVTFLNAFIKSAPRTQTKFYIQAEVCEAGLEPSQLQDWLKSCDLESPLGEQLRTEVRRWNKHCVDVEALQSRAERAEETCRNLSKKVATLQRQLHKLQLERLNGHNANERSKQFDDLQTLDTRRKDESKREKSQKKPAPEADKKVSSSAEDEGISFSSRSSSPEDPPSLENDHETTIDDVIEELRTIVKDAEDQLQGWPSPLKILVPSPEAESAIVPTVLHPQPPKRPPACLLLPEPLLDSQDDTPDGSDSLLSASRLVQRRPRCPSTLQRRRYLRRCQSQETVESGRPVLERIRKFESMNGLLEEARSGLRRAESLHRTRSSGASSARARGPGSDGGMTYAVGSDRSLSRIEEGRAAEPSFRGFFAGRQHDVLGFGRSRLNAGKYSGNNHAQQFHKAHRHVNAGGGGQGHRGKVTDLLSGLY